MSFSPHTIGYGALTVKGLSIHRRAAENAERKQGWIHGKVAKSARCGVRGRRRESIPNSFSVSSVISVVKIPLLR